jgi:hypothetical protein
MRLAVLIGVLMGVAGGLRAQPVPDDVRRIDGYLERAEREIHSLEKREAGSCLAMLVANYADAGQVERAQKVIVQAGAGQRAELERALVMSLSLRDPGEARKVADGIGDVRARDSAYRYIALHLGGGEMGAAREVIGKISADGRPSAWHEVGMRLIAEDNLAGARAVLDQLPAGMDRERLGREIELAQWLEGPIGELPAKAKKAGVELAGLSSDLRSAVGRLATRGQLEKAQALALYVSDPFQRGMAWASIALAQARKGDMAGYAKSIQLARDCAALAEDAFGPMLEATILRTDSEFGDVESILRQVKQIQADPDDLRQALVPQVMTQLCLRRGDYDAIVDLCLEDKTPLRSLFIQNVARDLAERGQTATVDKLLGKLTSPEDRARACLGAAMGLVARSNINRN